MNMFTKMSERGQVVVPKAMRDLKGWLTGTDLEVVNVQDGVLLRRRRPEKRLTVDEAVARLRQLYMHEGPPMSLTDMEMIASDEAIERDRHSR